MIALIKLDQRHPDYSPAKWSELDALVSGGDRFRSMIRSFLPQNEAEPDEVYELRSRESHYAGYLASLIALFCNWLFMGDLAIEAFERDSDRPIAELHATYGRLSEDVGGETSLADFAKERLSAALAIGAAHWLLELPSHDGQPARTLAEFESRGLGNVTLTPIDRCELVDWATDRQGRYTWALLHTVTTDRASFADDRDMVTETWSHFDATTVTRLALSYSAKDGRPDAKTEVPILESAPHGFSTVPLVSLVIPPSIVIGEQLRDLQLEVFRLDCALSWAIHRCAYPVPVFQNESDDRVDAVMGPGYALQLGPGESFKWATPPDSSFEVIRRVRDAKRRELYRLADASAAGHDENAESVGRSAESKAIDQDASRLRVSAYGAAVAAAIETTFEILSDSRGDRNHEWSVGINGYDLTAIPSLLASAKDVRDLAIDSPTLRRELDTRIAYALLPHVDQRLRTQIRKEIAGIADDLAA